MDTSPPPRLLRRGEPDTGRTVRVIKGGWGTNASSKGLEGLPVIQLMTLPALLRMRWFSGQRAARLPLIRPHLV